MKFATKAIQRDPPHLRHVATQPWESKNSNFCRYLADMEENANELHFKSLITARAYARAVLGVVIMSVCLSVTRVDCDKTK